MKTRKEIKEEYKLKKFRMGVYQIKNKLNQKIFIGSSPDLDAKWNSQKFQLNAGLHPNFELQKDWTEHGEQNFTYEILELLNDEDFNATQIRKELKKLEDRFIEKLQPFGDHGYHIKI